MEVDAEVTENGRPAAGDELARSLGRASWRAQACPPDGRRREGRRERPALVIALPLACALAVGAYSSLAMPDTYTASSTMYVMAKAGASEDSVTSQELNASQLVANDVAKLLKSDRVAEEAGSKVGVAEELGGLHAARVVGRGRERLGERAGDVAHPRARAKPHPGETLRAVRPAQPARLLEEIPRGDVKVSGVSDVDIEGVPAVRLDEGASPRDPRVGVGGQRPEPVVRRHRRGVEVRVEEPHARVPAPCRLHRVDHGVGCDGSVGDDLLGALAADPVERYLVRVRPVPGRLSASPLGAGLLPEEDGPPQLVARRRLMSRFHVPTFFVHRPA